MTCAVNGSLRRLRTVPDKNPRTEWACQPVAAIKSASVAPLVRERSFRTSDDLVGLEGLDVSGFDGGLIAGFCADRDFVGRFWPFPAADFGFFLALAPDWPRLAEVAAFALLAPLARTTVFLLVVISILLESGPDTASVPVTGESPGFGRRIKRIPSTAPLTLALQRKSSGLYDFAGRFEVTDSGLYPKA